MHEGRKRGTLPAPPCALHGESACGRAFGNAPPQFAAGKPHAHRARETRPSARDEGGQPSVAAAAAHGRAHGEQRTDIQESGFRSQESGVRSQESGLRAVKGGRG